MQYSNHNRILEYETLLRHVPAKSICGYDLPKKIRDKMIEKANGCSMLDLYYHLTKNPKSDPREFSYIRSASHIAKVKMKYLQFYDHISTRTAGRPPNPRISWILPDRFVEHGREISEAGIYYVERFFARPGLGITPLPSSYKEWLPYLSLGATNLIRRWRQPNFSALTRSVFKFRTYRFSDELSEELIERGFDQDYNEIAPIQALFQYEPSRSMLSAIKSCEIIGFDSVGHLAAFHSEAIAFIKDETNRQLLLKLYSGLNSSP